MAKGGEDKGFAEQKKVQMKRISHIMETDNQTGYDFIDLNKMGW
ncbi:MAG: hypothetical protein PVF37_07635 [Desulfobacterales bacterium]|jgi:hypothetical protein